MKKYIIAAMILIGMTGMNAAMAQEPYPKTIKKERKDGKKGDKMLLKETDHKEKKAERKERKANKKEVKAVKDEK